MINIFSKIRKKLAAENKLWAYSRYAIGEIVLVMIGILLALQVNNWNQNRIEQKELWGYLNNVKLNIKNDLKQASDFNYVRDRLANNTQIFYDLRSNPDFTFDDFKATDDHINTLFYLQPFQPNLYGFETLKSTGYIGKLQGTDMEALLASYYELANTINEWSERDRMFLDDILKENNKTDWGFTNENWFNIYKGSTTFDKMKKDYLNMLNSRIFDSAISQTAVNYYVAVLRELNFIGKSIVTLIDKKTLQASPEVMRSLELYNSDFSDIGQEEVVINGIVPNSIRVLRDSNLGFEKLNFLGFEDYIGFTINPNLEWAAAMFVVDTLGMYNKAGKNFSDFKSIQLELKGERGDEKLQLAIKDKFDPDDGTESRVDLQLTPNWETYTFDLRKSFPTADLKNLNMLAGFVAMNTKDIKFYIKNIRFLKD